MKLFKLFVCVSLIFVLTLPLNIHAVAHTILYESVDADTGITVEVFEANGHIFFSRNTSEYTFASELTPTGYYVFAFRSSNTVMIR